MFPLTQKEKPFPFLISSICNPSPFFTIKKSRVFQKISIITLAKAEDLRSNASINFRAKVFSWTTDGCYWQKPMIRYLILITLSIHMQFCKNLETCLAQGRNSTHICAIMNACWWKFHLEFFKKRIYLFKFPYFHYNKLLMNPYQFAN